MPVSQNISKLKALTALATGCSPPYPPRAPSQVAGSHVAATPDTGHSTDKAVFAREGAAIVSMMLLGDMIQHDAVSRVLITVWRDAVTSAAECWCVSAIRQCNPRIIVKHNIVTRDRGRRECRANVIVSSFKLSFLINKSLVIKVITATCQNCSLTEPSEQLGIVW